MTLEHPHTRAPAASAEAELQDLRQKVFDLSSRGYGLRARVVDYLNSDVPKEELHAAFVEWESCAGPRFMIVEDPRK